MVKLGFGFIKQLWILWEKSQTKGICEHFCDEIIHKMNVVAIIRHE